MKYSVKIPRRILANVGHHNPFKNVLGGCARLKIFDQGVRLLHVIVAQVIDHEVQARLWDEVDELWQDLQRLQNKELLKLYHYISEVFSHMLSRKKQLRKIRNKT